jgi:spore coat polysaccharide biosynthesis protein SpsF (cytidylyltransferase family)
MDFKLAVVIQARSGSTRLPGKVLKLVDGVSLIARLYRICSEIYHTIVAIPEDDSALDDHLHKQKIPYFAGAPTDVLSRYYECAKNNSLTHIVRVTGDCPMMSQETLFWMGAHGMKYEYDFYSNCGKGRKSIDGEDVEFMSFRMLEWLNENAIEQSDREHVTQYVYNNADNATAAGFNCGLWRDTGIDCSHIKSSIDTFKDFDRIVPEIQKEDA